jgi:hypothetical protein
MKIFAILTAASVAFAAYLFAAPPSFPWRAMLVAAQDDARKSAAKSAGQTKKKPESKDSKDNDAAVRQQTAQFAASLLARCRNTLHDDNVATYRADIDEDVHIGGRSFTAKGKYWKGTGRRFRLELNMVVGEGKNAAKARMLQVCDGEVLMTEQVMGTRKRYTRRNVKQILAAAAAAQQAPANTLLSEFGLGGMSGLVASLEQTMVFDTRTSIPTRGKQAIQIEGTWNQQYATHWANWSQQTRQQQLPAHVPERVRVLVDSDYYVRKIDYLRRGADGKSFTPLLSLSFRNIELNPKLDEKKLFQYVPEPGVYVEDTTAQYLQIFQPRPAGKN